MKKVNTRAVSKKFPSASTIIFLIYKKRTKKNKTLKKINILLFFEINNIPDKKLNKKSTGNRILSNHSIGKNIEPNKIEIKLKKNNSNLNIYNFSIIKTTILSYQIYH